MMSFKQLIFKNITKNGRAYRSYFFSSTFSVTLFFIFSMIAHHPALKDGFKGTYTNISSLSTIGFDISQAMVVLMSSIFLLYSFSVFLKGRKKELSIFLSLGMSGRQVRLMVFFENMLLGLSSIVTGSLLGLLFSKFCLLIAQNLFMIEKGLPFYFPKEALLLTFASYGMIFLLISLFTVFSLRIRIITELLREGIKGDDTPRVKWWLSALGVLSLLAAYFLIWSFVKDFRWDWEANNYLLYAGVVCCFWGTFLFFTQSAPQVILRLKRSKIFLRGPRMLLLSNLTYRMKKNSVMFFIIAIVASAAFIGMGYTMSIGGSNYVASQDSSFAYSYNSIAYDDLDKMEKEDRKNIQFITTSIEAFGYDYLVQDLSNPVFAIIIQKKSMSKWADNYLVFPLSKYNEMAEFKGERKLKLKNDQQALYVSNTNSQKQVVSGRDKKKNIHYQELEFFGHGGDSFKRKMEVVSVPQGYNIRFYVNPLLLVSDELYNQLTTKEPEDADYREHSVVIHFNEWNKDKKLNHKISQYFNRIDKEQFSEYEKKLEELGGDYDGLSEEEKATVDLLYPEDFIFFYSLFDSWVENNQSNGLIILVSFLLGSVFFSFASCIVYFRLFGELDRDGELHRALHISGTTLKERHRIVTEEMLIMFFLPLLIALLNFWVAMYCLSIYLDTSTMVYFFRIAKIYLVFQSVFFIILRGNYLKHLDHYAEYIS